MPRLLRALPAVVAPLLLASTAVAQTSAAQTAVAPNASPAFEARARELVAILSGSGDYAAFFSAGFQTAVPRERFSPINTQLTGAFGKPVAVEGMTLQTPHAGNVRIRYEKAIVAFTMAVDTAPPNAVSGLRVLGPVAAERTLTEVTAALNALPGTIGYAFAKLGAGAPELTVQHDPDRALAVGSAFKLVILAELVRATNAGERRWDDSVTLDGKPLPGGGYTGRPAGTRVSLRELGTQMISISDNSATDILLFALGREKVEAMLPVLGVKPDPRTVPYLATLEAFKLKWIDGGKLGDKYLALDEKGQRAMLAGEVASTGIAQLALMGAAPRTPSRIDSIEWFFSANDLIRIMDWLRRNTDGPRGADARAVLSKNPGLPLERSQYPFIGFKGGSEPGVINLTLLLMGTDGAWYAAASSWNDTTQPVAEARFVELMTALVKFAGPRRQ